jgi:hypothetical protein
VAAGWPDVVIIAVTIIIISLGFVWIGHKDDEE